MRILARSLALITFSGAWNRVDTFSTLPKVRATPTLVAQTAPRKRGKVDRASRTRLLVSSLGKDGEARSAAAAAASGQLPSLSPWESWCVVHLDMLYNQALSIRCPFWKRRASDFLDGMDQIMRFLVIRHKSLPLVAPPAAWRCPGDTLPKATHLSAPQLLEVIRSDWKVKTQKGYYITGRLNTTIYRDDCWFDGPDPDMPVRGLRKYINAASQLFEPAQSRAELLSLEVIPSSSRTGHDDDDNFSIKATWKMSGVLRLPWHPAIPEWTGSTTYHRDASGLIYKHVETWDSMSAVEAFVKTFWPNLGNRIWSPPSC